MAETKLCIYCLENKPIDAFSEEHIIPQFMGGSSDCSPAITNEVCKQCNSIFGRFVDAPVAKGFFLKTIEGGAWEACFDYDEIDGNVFPLIYLGKSNEIQSGQGEEVEVWLCPDGGTAWDFHISRGEDFDAFAGGDPYLRRKDEASRVYVFVSSQKRYWLLSNIKSAPAQFKEETIYFGADSDVEGQLPRDRAKGRFCQKDVDAIAERDKIRLVLNEGRLLKHVVKLDMLFDVRFLAKLAITFGHKLLGDEYGDLQYTDRLRSLLWTRRSRLDPAQHLVRMRSYFSGLQDYSLKPLSFPLGFVFMLKIIDENIVAAIAFPSGHFVQVSITDSSVDTSFSVRDYFVDEHVLISIPQLKRTLAPIKLNDYVAWATGNLRISELDGLKARITPRSQLPPPG
jgi:HNH endonuclease